VRLSVCERVSVRQGNVSDRVSGIYARVCARCERVKVSQACKCACVCVSVCVCVCICECVCA
jgi:hypothetical protein